MGQTNACVTCLQSRVDTLVKKTDKLSFQLRKLTSVVFSTRVILNDLPKLIENMVSQ